VTIITTQDSTGARFLDQLKDYDCYGGLDLAAVVDLTCFTLAWSINGVIYAHPWFFLPEDGLEARSIRDSVPYVSWSKQGHIELTPGSVTDWRYVVRRIKDLSTVFKIKEISFDQWGARDTVAELQDSGLVCVDTSQAISAQTAPAKRLQEAILSNKFVHAGNPCLRWNFDCTTIYSDVNGNIKVQKPDIGKSTKRIDGVVSLIMAISRLQNVPLKKKSIYATRGVRVF
jgi:phage terminase large subunit-like protein